MTTPNPTNQLGTTSEGAVEVRKIEQGAIDIGDLLEDIQNKEPYAVEQVIIRALAEFSLGKTPMGKEEARRWLSDYIRHVIMGKSPTDPVVHSRTRTLPLGPRTDRPWYGRTTASGHIVTVAGRTVDVDEAISGGHPMRNQGDGWEIDNAPERVPYSPHPDRPA
ncbi:hypothetical protein [Streptomyces sp. A30]|uniref:hypothetical protein n=1 Tax=Streptomyces sp. A30 TaxID=2789273 RepID=UPI00398166DD